MKEKKKTKSKAENKSYHLAILKISENVKDYLSQKRTQKLNFNIAIYEKIVLKMNIIKANILGYQS